MSRCWGSHAICLIKETKHEFLLYYHLDVFVGNQTLFSAFSSTVWQILHFEEAIDLIRMRLVWVLSLFFHFLLLHSFLNRGHSEVDNQNDSGTFPLDCRSTASGAV